MLLGLPKSNDKAERKVNRVEQLLIGGTEKEGTGEREENGKWS